MHRLPIIAAAAILALAPAACKDKSQPQGQPPTPKVGQSGGDDTLIHVPGNDSRLDAVKVEAQRRLPEFIEAFKASGGNPPCLIKVPLKVKDGPGTEHVWIIVTAVEGDSFKGLVAVETVGDIGYKKNDAITVKQADVEDWGYQKNGELVGNFSEPVLRQIEEERKRK